MKSSISVVQMVSAGVLAFVTIHSNASAQTLSQVDGGVIFSDINTIPSSPGVPAQGPTNDGGVTGVGGYEFFYDRQINSPNPAGNVVNLPTSYVKSVTPGSGTQPYVGGDYSTISIAGTSYNSGVLFANPSSAIPFVTIELDGTPPPSFDLGLLVDNNDEKNPGTLSLAIYHGDPTVPANQVGPTLKVNTLPDGAASSSNDFFYAEVSGAQAGDYLVVSAVGVPADGQVCLGGVTFDAVTTPEPSSYILMFAGLGMLIVVARVRSRSA